MLVELPIAEQERARVLFTEHHHDHLVCTSTIGKPGTRIFVDDATTPHSAFLVTWQVWGFIAGDPTNQAFNTDLHKAIRKRRVVDKHAWGLLLTAHPDGWLEVLPGLVAPSTLMPLPRRHYITTQMTYDWQASIPAGYEIRLLDHALLARCPDIKIPEDIQKLLKVEHPRRDGFGFVALLDGQIAAHAMLDVILGDEAEIGLTTQEGHRQRGLATVTSAAVIEYGFKLGLKLVRWDCAVDNAGSVRTAEKLGFAPQYEYMMHYFDY